jgi:hypothetical protein
MDLDDFYTVIQLLKESGCKEIKIEAEGFILDDPQQIERLHKSRVRELAIKVSEPYMSMEFSSYQARLYAGQNDLSTTGLVEKTAQTLDRHSLVRVLKGFLWKLWWVWPLPFLIFVLDVGLIDKLPPQQRQMPHVITAVLDVPVLLAFLVMFLYHRSFILHVRWKHESFAKRHKDRIEKVVFLLIGAVLAIAGQVIVKRIATP